MEEEHQRELEAIRERCSRLEAIEAERKKELEAIREREKEARRQHAIERQREKEQVRAVSSFAYSPNLTQNSVLVRRSRKRA